MDQFMEYEIISQEMISHQNYKSFQILKRLNTQISIINKIIIPVSIMSIKDFEIQQKLGEGAFGVVEKVKRISDGQQYALKRVKYMDLKQKDRNNALNEIRILASIDHPNIIKYKEAFFEENNKNLYTVMELAPGGDLASRIKSKIKINSTFYQYEIWTIGKDIINGIAALHQRNIIHRDVKPANIFFGEGDIAKIGDLNVSVLMKSNFAYTQTGTPYYASPQVWNNQPYSYECDIWSFGCVIYEMCCLRKPFEAKNIDKLYQKVKNLRYDPLSYRFSYDMVNVIQKCLAYKSNRISLKQLKKLFEMHTAPNCSQLSQISNSSKNLMETIKIPLNRMEFGSCLPKSKYQNPEQNSRIGSQTSIQQNPSILDRFLIPTNKPQVPKKTYLNIIRSQKNLGLHPRQISQIQSPSFREIINLRSPQKSSIVQLESDKQNLIRRKLRIGMGY